MSDFYTNVVCVGNNILYRGVENGRRVKLKVGYTPTMFLPAKKVTTGRISKVNTLKRLNLVLSVNVVTSLSVTKKFKTLRFTATPDMNMLLLLMSIKV